ncbi:OprD family porin [Pseudomonas oligotrophica]|uniref:OprD family porin n=1 Tax=Pseudomonas oligotrophica TaxID=2912055 RepID=UPI001F2E21A4|nr:OprD family porin [Pseudomonas oligotrophica]MCF7202372.1 OprD family porin [Pseudomonas oligotrophica]
MNSFSYVALVLAATLSPCLQAQEQTGAEGFLEGSSLSLTNRNVYFNRDFRHANAAQSYREEWAHGILARFESGYSQGRIGFGLDAHAALGIKLDGGRGRYGTGLLPVDSEGRAADAFGYAGGALKARISETELKIGDLIPTAPVFASTTTRLFTSTARGVQVLSGDLADLSLDAGYFTAIRDGSGSTNRDGSIDLTYAGAVDAPSARYLGGSYPLSERLSVSLYGATLEDVWHQYYANLLYALPLSGQRALTFNFNAYDSRSEGKQLAGEINNLAWSLSGAYSIGAHTFTLAHQQVNGDTPFDYILMDGINAGDSIYLANSAQYSDFNSPNEASVQARYDLDMAAYGVPGLVLMARYIKGDIDGSGYLGSDGPYAYAAAPGKEWERDLEARYVVQAGPAKNLALRLRYATHRGAGGDIDELRLISELPLQLF